MQEVNQKQKHLKSPSPHTAAEMCSHQSLPSAFAVASSSQKNIRGNIVGITRKKWIQSPVIQFWASKQQSWYFKWQGSSLLSYPRFTTSDFKTTVSNDTKTVLFLLLDLFKDFLFLLVQLLTNHHILAILRWKNVSRWGIAYGIPRMA